MTIKDLIEKRNQAFEAAKSFAASHATDKGTLNDEDYETYQKMEKEIENFSREISRMQRLEGLEQEMSQPLNTPLTSKPQVGKHTEEKTGRASDDYKSAMLGALRSNFRNVSNVLTEGIDSDGGYLVPEEYDRRLIDVLDEENIMRSLATKITTSGEHKINIAATKPAASWIEEGGALTFGDATFDQIIMDAYKLHVAIKVTEELLYDNAFGLENYIITQFGKALANAEEDAFLNGDGNGKPLGLSLQQVAVLWQTRLQRLQQMMLLILFTHLKDHIERMQSSLLMIRLLQHFVLLRITMVLISGNQTTRAVSLTDF